MNNSEMFKKAHKIARQTVAVVGNYSIAFKLALKQVWAVAKASEKKWISHNQMAVMYNCSIYDFERRDAKVSYITEDEINSVEEALTPFRDELSFRQFYYAVWYCLLGKKVDPWLDFISML